MHTHIQDTITMLNLTDKFDSVGWASSFQQQKAFSATEVNGLAMLSQAYKTAALLYGRRVLGTQWTEAQDNAGLVSQLLGLIQNLKGDTRLFKCLLWPTFIAGLDSLKQSEQDFVIGSLEMLWNSTHCLNVISASKILRGHWRRLEQSKSLMQGVSDIDGLGHGWLLI